MSMHRIYLISFLAFTVSIYCSCVSSKRLGHSSVSIANLAPVLEPKENTQYYLQFYGSGLHDISKYTACGTGSVDIRTELFKTKSEEEIEHPEKYLTKSSNTCESISFLKGYRFLLDVGLDVAYVPTFIKIDEIDRINQRDFNDSWHAVERNKNDPGNHWSKNNNYYIRIKEWVDKLGDKRVLGKSGNYGYPYCNAKYAHRIATINFEKNGVDPEGNQLYAIYIDGKKPEITHQTSPPKRRYLKLYSRADLTSSMNGISKNDVINASQSTNVTMEDDISIEMAQKWRIKKRKTVLGDVISFQEQSSKKFLRIAGCSSFDLLQ